MKGSGSEVRSTSGATDVQSEVEGVDLVRHRAVKTGELAFRKKSTGDPHA